jgi:hypothetical protein
MDGTLDTAMDMAGDSTLDDATDMAGDGPLDDAMDMAGDSVLEAATDRADCQGADVEMEGDRDEWGMSVTKNSVSLVWFLMARMCSGRRCVRADFAAMSGPWEWAFCFPEHQWVLHLFAFKQNW